MNKYFRILVLILLLLIVALIFLLFTRSDLKDVSDDNFLNKGAVLDNFSGNETQNETQNNSVVVVDGGSNDFANLSVLFGEPTELSEPYTLVSEKIISENNRLRGFDYVVKYNACNNEKHHFILYIGKFPSVILFHSSEENSDNCPEITEDLSFDLL